GQRVARQLGAAVVRSVLARPADGELDEERGDRQDDDGDERRDGVSALAVVAAAAEDESPLRDLREVADRAGERGDDRHDERVAVANVPKLVSDARAQLTLSDEVEAA